MDEVEEVLAGGDGLLQAVVQLSASCRLRKFELRFGVQVQAD